MITAGLCSFQKTKQNKQTWVRTLKQFSVYFKVQHSTFILAFKSLISPRTNCVHQVMMPRWFYGYGLAVKFLLVQTGKFTDLSYALLKTHKQFNLQDCTVLLVGPTACLRTSFSAVIFAIMILKCTFQKFTVFIQNLFKIHCFATIHATKFASEGKSPGV